LINFSSFDEINFFFFFFFSYELNEKPTQTGLTTWSEMRIIIIREMGWSWPPEGG